MTAQSVILKDPFDDQPFPSTFYHHQMIRYPTPGSASSNKVQLVVDEPQHCRLIEKISPKTNTRQRCRSKTASYRELITNALMSSPTRKMTLSDIYTWIETNNPEFINEAIHVQAINWKVRLDLLLFHLER